VVDIDGARVRFAHGWGLVRASNTQPVLVLRFEADSEEHLHAIRADVEATVERARDA
jgi:phosphomannomutase/phosphoglucomutase